jgi:hypothetical protein
MPRSLKIAIVQKLSLDCLFSGGLAGPGSDGAALPPGVSPPVRATYIAGQPADPDVAGRDDSELCSGTA